MSATQAKAREEETGGEGGSVLTAAAIAQLTGGALHGDAGARVSSVASLDRARAGQLSFCASARYAPMLTDTRASVVLVSPDVASAPTSATARVVVDRPHESMLALLPRLYVVPPRQPAVHPSAVIGRGARIGPDAVIGPYVSIAEGSEIGARVTLDAGVVVGAGARLGDDVHLYPGVTVYPGARLGNRVLIHAGARIGSDGFGYVYVNGAHAKIPHVGGCLVEDDVEIGANATIDRGSIDDTVIGAGSKIDNLVHVAHNVRIGRLCLIAAQTGISGSVRIEDGVVIGGQVGLAGHHTIGTGAKLAAQAGVFGDVPAGETWSGYPARPHRESLRAHAALFKLSGMMKRLERLLAADDRMGDDL